MVEQFQIRSVSFDTSFLLRDDPLVDRVINILVHDQIPCFVTATVASELEQLKIWGRITPSIHKKAIKRWIHAHAVVINFKNRLLSDTFSQTCMNSMQNYGIPAKHVINDCAILVSALKNGIDLFLSEDYHFTSAITKEVINKVKSAACSEFFLMCNSKLFSFDTKTFLESYSKGTINLDIVQARMKRGRKENIQSRR